MNDFLNTSIEIKQVSWPPHNSCTGDCQQGRNCRCTVPEDDKRETMTPIEGYVLAAILVLSAGAVGLGLYLAMPAASEWVSAAVAALWG